MDLRHLSRLGTVLVDALTAASHDQIAGQVTFALSLSADVCLLQTQS